MNNVSIKIIPIQEKSKRNSEFLRRGGKIGQKSRSNITKSFRDKTRKTIRDDLPPMLLWPEKLRKVVISTFNKPANEVAMLKFLEKYDWPIGLYHSLCRNVKKLSFRFFIVDDSGSMATEDGKVMVRAGVNTRMNRCSRWHEVKEILEFLAELSEVSNIPSEFRLLNGADPVIVGLGNVEADVDDDNGESLEFAREVFNEPPAGMTPLCTHIQSVVTIIQSMSSELIANSQKVALVIMTDGIATDGDVSEALRPLQFLPVWVVIRLCTADKNVMDYWNNIDKILELNIDVIQNYPVEADQVYQINNWLTYGEPLHRLREFGISSREVDLIDKVPLGKEQIRAICRLLFTDSLRPEEIPHPDADWKEFIKKVKYLSSHQPKVYCPIEKKMKPWINIAELQSLHNKNEANMDVSLISILVPTVDKNCVIS